MRLTSLTTAYILLLALLAGSSAAAQAPNGVTGRVLDASTRAPLAATLVAIEGTSLTTVTDSTGRFRLARVPAGSQVLRVERLGYATARVAIAVPSDGVLDRDVQLAVSALQMPGLIVTADPAGRARGELGTASVIDREAIRHQTAASVAQILELVPGIPLQPPGLDQVQQISLRSSPTSSLSSEALGPSAANLAAAGTLIVLDGVPLSNNANLQSLGPRGELALAASSAGGGIDLRRIPAALLDRVEVIRGVPSARYGDLTQGAVVVDTRAGVVEPELTARRDRQTTDVSLTGGRALGGAHTATLSLNAARTFLSPGLNDDEAYRVAAQLAHRATAGADERLTLDTRIDYYQLFQDSPEQLEVLPGRKARSRDSGLRIAERARWRLAPEQVLEVTASLDRQRQRSYSQRLLTRGALPFTRSRTEGRAIGHYVGGSYTARADVNGDPWLAFVRAEANAPGDAFGFTHELRAGLELRREWNSGPGYQFDMEFPPQSSFNGVQGFDRPRRYDEVPPQATSALYIDDRLSRLLAGRMLLTVQAGLRADVLHSGTSWFSGSRHTVAQPRLNAQLAATEWLRLRAGAGRTSKVPTLAQLHPAPQYHDVVNVNWYANDPAERLAVLTTSIVELTNPELRQAVTDKLEAGFEVGFGASGAGLSVVAFSDRMQDAIGIRRVPGWLPREHFQLSDSTPGSGRPPTVIEPADRTDTIPVLLYQPANSLALETRGYEFTATLPEWRRLQTRLEIQGAWFWTRLESTGIEVGSYFQEFQLGTKPRTPYWSGSTATGNRVLLNYRLIHQQPAIGLVITATVQHVPHDVSRNLAATDSTEFAGYITRTGELVPVPEGERGLPEYRDIRLPRRTIITEERRAEPGWLLSLQVSKTLPLHGRLSFYAFNLPDARGRFGNTTTIQRLHPPRRFGLEVTLVPGALFR